MRQTIGRFAAALLLAVPTVSGQPASVPRPGQNWNKSWDIPGEYTMDGGYLAPGVSGPEITSTSADKSPATPAQKSCTHIFRDSLTNRVGDACVVPVGSGSAKFRVNVAHVTPTQFDVTIEPLTAMPPTYASVAHGKPKQQPLPSSITPPGLPIHRILRLEESLDIPVPEVGGVVHLRFHLTPGKEQGPARGYWGDTGLEEVHLASAAPAPLVGATRDWPGAEPHLRTDGPTILLPNLQYNFRKYFENSGPKGDLRWVSLPGLGRFLLSLQPRPELGFQLAGEVQQNTIRVALGDVRFDVISTKPTLNSPDAFRLYVRVDPNPASSIGDVPAIGSVDLGDLTPLPGR